MAARYKWFAIILMMIGIGMTACKPKTSGKKSTSNKLTEQRKLACTNSQGEWKKVYCYCTGNYQNDPNDEYRCKQVNTGNANPQNDQQFYQTQRQSCIERGYDDFSTTYRKCVDNDPGDPRNLTTYEQCDRANYWWDGDECRRTFNQNDPNACMKTGDYDPNTRTCQRYNAYEKRSRCESRQSQNSTQANTRWNGTTGECECPSNLIFNWAILDCVTPDQWNQTVFGEQEGCQRTNGNWSNGTCFCSYQNTRWDPRINQCASISGAQGVCPGYYAHDGICWGMNGKQFVFNYLLGWVLNDALTTGD